MLSSLVSTDEADCPDFGMCTDCVDGRDSPMDDVEDTIGQTYGGG